MPMLMLAQVAWDPGGKCRGMLHCQAEGYSCTALLSGEELQACRGNLGFWVQGSRVAPRLPVVQDGLALVRMPRLANARVHQRARAVVHRRDGLAGGVHGLDHMLQLPVVRPVPRDAMASCAGI